MRATRLEYLTTEGLRDLCARRNVTFRVARCPDGAWRGVLLRLVGEPEVITATQQSRLALVEDLTTLLVNRWPLRMGRKLKAVAA